MLQWAHLDCNSTPSHVQISTAFDHGPCPALNLNDPSEDLVSQLRLQSQLLFVSHKHLQ